MIYRIMLKNKNKNKSPIGVVNLHHRCIDIIWREGQLCIMTLRNISETYKLSMVKVEFRGSTDLKMPTEHGNRLTKDKFIKNR